MTKKNTKAGRIIGTITTRATTEKDRARLRQMKGGRLRLRLDVDDAEEDEVLE